MPSDFFKNTSWFEVVHVFFSASRYDFSVASALIFFPVMGTLFLNPSSKKITDTWGNVCFWYIQICLYFSTIFILGSHYFFYYYNDHFNIFFWEFWENWENAKLVYWSFFDELPLLNLSLSVLLFFALINIFHRIFYPLTTSISGIFSKKISLILIPILLLLGVRGTFDRLPLSMQRYRGQISSVNHLNLIHGNPFYELYASWENQANSSDTSKIKFFLEQSKIEIPKWFERVSESDDARYFKGGDETSYHIEYKIPALREKYLKKKPRHIVLIFMESHSSWLFSFKGVNYEKNIIKNLNKIKKQSLSFEQYFAAGNSSTSNLMKVNLSITTKKNFQTAFTSEIFKSFQDTFPRIMNSHGYRSKFFFGGSLNYHRLNYLMPKLGFQEMFGESSIKNVSKTRFGVHDGDLLDFVHQNLLNAKQSTFNFVVTISNHPPYEVPKNFIGLVNSRNAPLSLKNKIIDSENFNKRMRALAYADKAIGDFFEKAKESPYFNETLFVLTADHPHSMSLKWLPEDFFQRIKIPLLFYSPSLLKTTKSINENYGSHTDLSPTILSMILEKSVKIKSWGRSLLVKPKVKLLTSHYIDCLENVCITNENTFVKNIYVVENKEKLSLCEDELCLKNSKQLKKITEAFQNSGLNYFINYRVE